jgi:hypothetical protein
MSIVEVAKSVVAKNVDPRRPIECGLPVVDLLENVLSSSRVVADRPRPAFCCAPSSLADVSCPDGRRANLMAIGTMLSPIGKSVLLMR